MMNVVPSPSWLSVFIVPLCSFVMISYAKLKPNPVLSPVGFVVKKGLKILSMMFFEMPLPLSFTLISTLLFGCFVLTKTSGL